MQLRLLGSRITTLLKRSNWVPKVVISCGLLLIIFSIWYFGLQVKLFELQSKTILKIAELKQHNIIFNEVLAEYKTLNEKLNNKKNIKIPVFNSASCCKCVVDYARHAGLTLDSYTSSKIKNHYKQMVFNFTGPYDGLLAFLHNLDRDPIAINCNKLKITSSGHRLQIAYVCGIHTFVK
jgi:hypothetical protein